jgi:hypothetical protein
MTTARAVGAVSREAADWYAINWQATNRNVHRLQVRIVQATKASRWGKVRAVGVEAVKPTEDEKPLLYMTAEQAVYGPGRTGCDCLQPNGCASCSSFYAV